MKLVISNTRIHQDAEGRFSLNDLHRAAGGISSQRPGYFLENDQTKALIAEIDRTPEGDVLTAGIPAVKTREGRYGGSYVAKELVYAYAMWISPKFHLLVIRTFDEVATGKVVTNPRARVLTPTQQFAANREISRLSQQIKRETNPALRRMQHAQLEQTGRLAGIPVPPLEEIGHDALPDHESPALEEFWEVVDMLEQSGHTLNHARDKALLAINLPQVRAAAIAARLALPETAELHRLLHASLQPRFVAVKAVNSALCTATVKCWVFAPRCEHTDDLFGGVA